MANLLKQPKSPAIFGESVHNTEIEYHNQVGDIH